jgi:glycosyltransferase involved in cell wall biosynthesis
MKLSLVIPAYNSADTISEQFAALATQEWSDSWEVILADNNSTDETVAIAKRYEKLVPNLQIVDAGAKRGPAFARNMGVTVARGEAVVFIDADDIIAPGWLAAIGDALKQFDFVASRLDMDYLNQGKYQDYAGGTQTTGLQKLWYPPYYVHAASCSLGIRRDIHLAVGGFDEAMPRLQDTDYCIRVQQQGTPLQFVPDAVVYKRNRNTAKGVYKQAASWGQYNTLLYKRYRPTGERLQRPWLQYWRDWYKVLRRLARGRREAQTIYKLGWQVGLLKGAILYWSAPAVVPEIAQLSEKYSTS